MFGWLVRLLRPAPAPLAKREDVGLPDDVLAELRGLSEDWHAQRATRTQGLGGSLNEARAEGIRYCGRKLSEVLDRCERRAGC